LRLDQWMLKEEDADGANVTHIFADVTVKARLCVTVSIPLLVRLTASY